MKTTDLPTKENARSNVRLRTYAPQYLSTLADESTRHLRLPPVTDVSSSWDQPLKIETRAARSYDGYSMDGVPMKHLRVPQNYKFFRLIG